MQSLQEYIVGNCLFPFSNYFFNRKGIISKYKKLIQSDHYSQDQLQSIQLQKIKDVLDYAYTNVPFYTKRFKEIRFHPQDIQKPEDIKNLPVLTRQEVIDFHQEMIDKQYNYARIKQNTLPGEPKLFACFKKQNLVRNTSSGSTGAPTVFYENGAITASNWAHELRLKHWFGIFPGQKEARFVRLSIDALGRNNKILFRELLWNQQILPGINLSDDDYKICFDKLNAFKPRVFWGFTSALAGFARFLNCNKQYTLSFQPSLCVGWAAPLYDHEKEIIEAVFKCPCTNIYSAREVGHIAAYCSKGGFHINQETHFVETVQSPSTDMADGAGELAVTTLEKTPMPFIRYLMGDIGTIAPSSCSCGITLQMLQNFLGRTGEIFITKTGKMIAPNFWCRTFMNGPLAGMVNRFQIVYTKEKNITINIVKSESYTPDAETYLYAHAEKNFTQDTKVTVQYVPCIEPLVSGKYQMVVTEK